MAIKSSNDLQINGLLSESSHYLIISKESSSGMIKALHLESNDEVQLGVSYILNHTDSADIFEKEKKELECLSVFVPALLSEDDTRRLVDDAVASGAANIGAVMKALPKNADRKFASAYVRELFSKKL